MEGFNHSRRKEWAYFFDKIGLAERHGLTKLEIEDEIKKCDYSLFDQPRLTRLLREARNICSEIPNNIKFLNLVLREYNSTTYSLDYSKEAIKESVKQLSKKYSLIPLVYTTLTLPSYVNYGSQVWREIFSINSFKKDDYGHLDFFQALLALQKEKFIKIISVHFLDIRQDILTIKIEVEYQQSLQGKVISKNISNPYSYRIKNVRDLMRDCNLVKKLKEIFEYGYNMERGHSYTYPTDEKNDSIVSLLIDLGLVEYNWNELEKQNHREVGNRIIEFSFDANSIIGIFDQLNGSGSFVRKQSLKYFSQQIASFDSGSNLAEFLQNCGVPRPLIDYPDASKWAMINTVLTYYATSKEEGEQKILFKILEEAIHPLMHNGNKEKSIELQDDFSTYLQYDGYCFSDGKIVKKTNEVVEQINKRQNDRANRPVDPAFQGLLSNLFHSPKPEQKPAEPLLIKIVGETDVRVKGLEEKIVLQKPKNHKIQLRKFPADLKWEEISIQFLNEHEVIVKARNETLQTNYETMGFQDERKKLPNKQWQFLRLLSIKNGEISWDNNLNLTLKQINSIKKQKQLLVEALKAYFQISNDESFYDYKKEKAYRIKINLIPEPEFKDVNEQEIYDE